MKTLLCAVLIAFSTLVSAQSKETKVTFTVNCFDRDVVLNLLTRELKEKIVFAGIDTLHAKEGVLSFMTHNTDNEEYTIGLFLTKSNLACIIGAGSGSFSHNSNK